MAQPAGLMKPQLPVLQRGHVLAQGLVGAWMYVESGAVSANAGGQVFTIHDYTENLNNGTTTGNAAGTAAIQWTGGLNGIGSFTTTAGSTEVRTSIPNAGTTSLDTVLKSGEFSVAAWARLDALVSGQSYIFCKQYDGTSEPFTLRATNAPLLEMTTFNVGATFNPQMASNPTGWFHVLGTVSLKKGLAILYVNGSFAPGQTTTASGSISYTNTNPFAIGGAGASAGNNRPWAGMIDSVLFWNRALSADDARLLYEDHYAMFRVPSFAPAFRTPPPPVIPMMGQIWI